jgi:hypothetical protein
MIYLTLGLSTALASAWLHELNTQAFMPYRRKVLVHLMGGASAAGFFYVIRTVVPA